jgi:hypothetical protein
LTRPVSHSRLELRYSDFEDYVEVLVDGEPLAKRLLSADPNPGDDTYDDDTGLGWGDVDSAWRTVFDQEFLLPGTHHGILFSCSGCNIIGCSDTGATITVTESTVTLSNFSFRHRPPIATPISFDRDQFIAEVSKMNAWHANTWPEEHRRKAQRRAGASWRKQ